MTMNRVIALLVFGGVLSCNQGVYGQRRPPIRKVTPEVAKQLAAIRLGRTPHPAGGYLYPERVGERWEVTKKFHYEYGVPPGVMAEWAPYVMPPPPHDPAELARVMKQQLQDENPKRPGFQTTVAGRCYTLNPRLYDLGVVSVRNFGAAGDGRHDDTDAIQLAIDFARDNMLVCYFPSGDYLVSRTLRCYHLFEIWHNGTLHAAHENHICLVGPSHGPRARIVLKAGTFPERIPNQRRFVIWTQFLNSMRTLGSRRRLIYQMGPLGRNDSASFFCPALRHLDIVIRPDNAGASGLYFVAAEHSTLRDVRIIFEPNPDGSPNGEVGVSGLPGSGGSVHNLIVRGGEAAIELVGWDGRSFSGRATATRPAPTVSNSQFIGQRQAAVRGTAQGTLSLVGCRFVMATSQPAIQMVGRSPESTPAVIDSVIEYPDDAPAAAVVKPAATREMYPAFYFENCYVRNAAALDSSGAFPLNKHGWYHVRRAARTRRTRRVSEPLRLWDEKARQWIPWTRKDPRCTVRGKQILFNGRPVELPDHATAKETKDGVEVTFTLGEPVVSNGRVSFGPLMDGEAAGPGAYWERMRQVHNYRRELGFDTPGLANVKDFGAVGDGRTDDTAALRRAIASGRSLLLPRGAYRVTGTLALRPGQTLVGVDKCWSILAGAQDRGKVFGGAARRSAAGRKALDSGVPLVVTAGGDRADNTLCDLALWMTYGYREAKTPEDARISGCLLRVQGGGCEVIDLQFRTSKNWWPMTGSEARTSPYGDYKGRGNKFMEHAMLQVGPEGGVKIYNFCGIGGRHYPRERTYVLIRNQRHPVRFYHMQLQGPSGFGLRLEGSTGGFRAYGVKSEHAAHCLLYAENSRNFGWYGYGAGGSPRPERVNYGALPPANYRMQNCDDFLVAAYSQRVQHPNFLTYDAIREVRHGGVVPLSRTYRPILYLRGTPRACTR